MTEAEYQYLRVDAPAEYVRRIAPNRPHKRNALSNALRSELFAKINS